MVYLIRHAHAKRYPYLTNEDLGLSEEGKKNVELVAKELKRLKIERIISSPLRRAVETSRLLSKHLGVEVKIDKRFEEYNYGKAEGLSFDEIKRRYKIKTSEGKFFAEEALRIHNYFGYESYDSVISRVMKALNELKEKRRNTLVVTHGEVIRSLFAYIQKDRSYLLDRGKLRVKPLACFRLEKEELVGM